MTDADVLPIWREWHGAHPEPRKELEVSYCRACSAEVLWVTTENDKAMPLDVEPDNITGRFRKERVEGDKRIVKRLRDSELEANTRPLYTCHLDTCPERESYRRT